MNNLGKAAISFLFIFLFAANAYAQSGKNALSFQFTPSYGYRFLVTDDKGNFQKNNLGTSPENLKKNLDSSESGVFTYSFGLNYIRKINQNFSVSAGIGYLKMGKKRTMLAPPGFYQTTDGTYIPLYTEETIDLNSHIHYVSLPVALQYNLIINKKINVIASGGIVPMYAVNWSNPIAMYSTFTQADGHKTQTIYIPVNRFVLGAEAALGISYKLNEKLEFQLSPNYLQQLTPSVTYWDDLKQYNYNLGLKFGTKVNL